jgi:hypothetical protein
MGNRVRKLFVLAAGVLASGAFADIASPAQLNCTVTTVAPVGANFFGFGKGPVAGDKTVLDLGGTEVPNLKFSSGAQIGATVTKHNLIKQTGAWEGVSLFEVKFTSKSNGQNYHARLIADDQENATVKVSLDVLEVGNMARLRLHSIELTCIR